MMNSTEQFLSPSEAARRLNLSASRVRQLAEEGRLMATSTPLGRLFDSTDVARLAAERLCQRTDPKP